MKKLVGLLLALITIYSCTPEPGKDGVNGRDGIDGTNGINGTNGIDGVDGVDGVSIGMFTEATSDLCTLLTFFVDTNNNGEFDNETIIDSFEVCSGIDGQNGENGFSIGLRVETASATDCPNSGFVYTFFLDKNSNNTQEEGENTLVSTSICNGLDGIPVGIEVLAASRDECPDGGWVVNVFADINGNGEKEEGEDIISTKTSCFPEEVDTDNDGIPDAYDNCPATEQGVEVNAFGCALYQLDTDGDGVTDDLDVCPNTTEGTEVNAQGCDSVQYSSIVYSFTNILIDDIKFEDASVSINFEQTEGEAQDVTEVGFEYGSNGTIDKVQVGTNTSGTISVASFTEGLTYNTIYTIKPYIKNQYGTYYGSSSEFSTLNSRYNFSNTTSSNREFTTATISSSFAHINSEAVDVLEKGFYVSTSTSDLDTKPNVVAGDELNLSLTGLSTGTKYYFQAYVKNKFGESKSSVTSFTTKNDTPTFSFTSVESTVSTITATFNVKAQTTPTKLELELTDSSDNVTVIEYDGDELSNTTIAAGASIEFNIPNLNPNSRYDYKLRLTSAYGTYESQSYGYSTKDDEPTATLSLEKTGNNQITVTSSITAADGANVIRAYLEYKNQEQDTYSFVELNTSGETTVVNDLIQGPSYEFKLTVQNNFDSYNYFDYSTLPVTYAVGDEMFGGIIAYIDESGYHGLILAEKQYHRKDRFFNFNNFTTEQFALDPPNYTQQNYLDGSEIINGWYEFVNENSLDSPAITYVYNLDLNGYTDWYLPTQLELTQIDNFTTTDEGIAFVLDTSYYWTSNVGTTTTAIRSSNSSNTMSVIVRRLASNSGTTASPDNSNYNIAPVRKF